MAGLSQAAWHKHGRAFVKLLEWSQGWRHGGVPAPFPRWVSYSGWARPRENLPGARFSQVPLSPFTGEHVSLAGTSLINTAAATGQKGTQRECDLSPPIHRMVAPLRVLPPFMLNEHHGPTWTASAGVQGNRKPVFGQLFSRAAGLTEWLMSGRQESVDPATPEHSWWFSRIAVTFPSAIKTLQERPGPRTQPLGSRDICMSVGGYGVCPSATKPEPFRQGQMKPGRNPAVQEVMSPWFIWH